MDQKNQIQVYTPCEQDEINHFGLLSSKRRIIISKYATKFMLASISTNAMKLKFRFQGVS